MKSVKLSHMRKIMKMQIQPQVVLKAYPKPSMLGFALTYVVTILL